MTEPILVTRNFNHHITTKNQIMVMENGLNMASMYFQAKLFLKKNLRKFKKILGFRCQFNQISYILAKFHKYFNTKKMNKINNGRLPFASKHIAPNEYLLILFHYSMFMTFYQSILYLHMDTPPLQYVKILARNSLGA